MNMMRHQNPWNLFNQLQRELNSHATMNHDEESEQNWAPAVDIHENDSAYTLLVDIPGVDPKDIDVSMEKSVLSIKGERKKNLRATESEGVKRIERKYGLFARQFTLPEEADAEHIDAKADNGVLTITIPKQEVAVSRRIDVKH